MAAALGVHRNVARARLERLLAAGLVLTSFEQRSGRTGPGAGRPTKVYEPAPELAAIEFPGRHIDALVAALVDDIDPAERDAALARAGAAFSRTLAERGGLRGSAALPAAAEAVCAAMRSLGFQAAVDRVDGVRGRHPHADVPAPPGRAGERRRGRARPRALVGPARTRAPRRRVGDDHLRDARVPRPGRLVRGAPRVER